MSRNYPDFLKAFCDYASYGEAPRRFYFWSGVSTVAGALRRKVWIDMKRYFWYPNFFIVLVAPPGVATKSTTADLGSKLLGQVPGIKFGPSNITWQALATAFANAHEEFPIDGSYYPMSAITLVARELGSLLNPRDPDLMNLLIELWDGAVKYEKETKMSGNDTIVCPWINVIGCTTPSWISDNVPLAALRGGFISRCVFLYANDKEHTVPYVDEAIPIDDAHTASLLVDDLTRISELAGPFTIATDAREWGRQWYVDLWSEAKKHYSDDQVMGFISRKQTHMHKLAMVLSASRGSDLLISLEDLSTANTMLADLEGDMNKVFASVGRSETSLQTEKFINFIKSKGTIPYMEGYRYIHHYFPDAQDFGGIVAGAVQAGYIKTEQIGNSWVISYVGP